MTEDFRENESMYQRNADEENAPGDLTGVIKFSEELVSNSVRRILELAINVALNLPITLTGLITNIIVIRVFCRQGFKESVGIAMTAIAAWDLIKSFAGFMQRAAYVIGLWSPAAGESWSNISTAYFNNMVSFSTYVSSGLAAYVAIERCLCVTIPLKVKWLLTPKLVTAVCLTISFTVFGSFVVMFGIYDIYTEFDPRYNSTVTFYKYNQFSVNNTLLFSYNNLYGALWPVICLVIIVASTVIISYKLRQASAFRYERNETFTQPRNASARKPQSNFVLAVSGQLQSNTSSPRSPCFKRSSRRDQQVIRMLLVIIALYIFSLVPRVIHYFFKYLVPDYNYLRRHHNMVCVIAYTVRAFDFLNGSANFFVFYAMSTSFRYTCQTLFPACCRVRFLRNTQSSPNTSA